MAVFTKINSKDIKKIENIFNLGSINQVKGIKKGIENTIQSLEKVGILSAGTTSKPYTIFEKNGLKYGFTAFSPNKKTQQINNYLFFR